MYLSFLTSKCEIYHNDSQFFLTLVSEMCYTSDNVFKGTINYTNASSSRWNSIGEPETETEQNSLVIERNKGLVLLALHATSKVAVGRFQLNKAKLSMRRQAIRAQSWGNGNMQTQVVQFVPLSCSSRLNETFYPADTSIDENLLDMKPDQQCI